MLACRMKRLARKLYGNGGITHHVHGRPFGTLREEQGKEGAKHETAWWEEDRTKNGLLIDKSTCT